MLDLPSVLLLVGAGFLAGVMNAVAGGGTFFTFPALLSVGLPPVTANATSALAVWPGHAAAVPAAWGLIRGQREGLALRCAVALAGGLLGVWLLLATGERAFAALVPRLLLLATVLFALGPRLRALMPTGPNVGRGLAPLGLAVGFAAAVYGGYFGAGLGVLLMAGLALLGHGDAREANAIKNLLASVVTSVAVVAFVVAGAIAWEAAVWVLGGAIAGGVVGARVVARIPVLWLRWTVIGVGAALTVVFFVRAYGGLAAPV